MLSTALQQIPGPGPLLQLFWHPKFQSLDIHPPAARAGGGDRTGFQSCPQLPGPCVPFVSDRLRAGHIGHDNRVYTRRTEDEHPIGHRPADGVSGQIACQRESKQRFERRERPGWRSANPELGAVREQLGACTGSVPRGIVLFEVLHALHVGGFSAALFSHFI